MFPEYLKQQIDLGQTGQKRFSERLVIPDYRIFQI